MKGIPTPKSTAKYSSALLASALVAGLASPSVAGPKPTSTKPKTAASAASGTITVNSTTSMIRFGYARQVPGFFDPTKNDVEVVLSDAALKGPALTDPFARAALARRGKAHMFEITVDSDGQPVSTAFRHSGFAGPSPSGLDSSDMFTKRTLTATAVSARYQSSTAHEFFGDTYAFDVTFALPILARGK